MKQPNWNGNILVFYKQGNQEHEFGGYKHNEIVTYIDPEEWTKNVGFVPILSDKNIDTIAYASILLPRTELQNIKDIINTNNEYKKIEMGNPRLVKSGKTNKLVTDKKQKKGRILLNNDLAIFNDVRNNWLEKDVRVEPIEIKLSLASIMKEVSKEAIYSAQIKDANAWTGGAKTFGSGGDYASRLLMYADIGNPATEYFATQISSITESSVLWNVLANMQNYNEDGGDFLSVFVNNNDHRLWINYASSSTFRFENLYFQNPGVGSNPFYVYVHNGSTQTVFINDSKFDGKSQNNNYGPLFLGAGLKIRLWNVLVNGFVYGMQVKQTDANLENIVFANNTNGLEDETNVPVVNSVFVGNTNNFFTHIPSESINCATNKVSVGATLDTAAQVSLSAANQFKSMDVSASNAYVLRSDSVLTTNGTSAIMAENAYGFYGNDRPGPDALYSIGLDELINVVVGLNFRIEWTTDDWIGPDGDPLNVKIELSRNNKSSWSTIISSTSNIGYYDWTVTRPATTQAFIRISDPTDGANYFDSYMFSIIDTGLGPTSTQGYAKLFGSTGFEFN